jgi:hypothetical protein
MNVSIVVVAPPGARTEEAGSEPVKRLVIGFGVTGFGRAVEEVE